MDKTLVYQLYPRAWQGIKEMTEHLRRVAALGADYVWLSPIYPSPGYDHGYDISDYKDIDPRFGTFKDFIEFVEEAHNLGIGVIMDLVMNHTSTEHPWFATRPDYYCWSETDRQGWHNLFDNGSAWEFDEARDKYYLHLFHKEQADLNWFPNGPEEINYELVNEFREIVDFWMDEYLIDGFRIDAPQAINKDINSDKCASEELINGSQATRVIQEVFRGTDAILIAECTDPTMGDASKGDITNLYHNAGVKFVLNIALKEKIYEGEDALIRAIINETKNDHYMLDLESHDSPRLPSLGLGPEEIVWIMFHSKAKAICLYQGQELGLYNPTPEELPDEKLIELDAETAMRVESGEDINELRMRSRANARLPIPLGEYDAQEQNPSSNLNLTKRWIEAWRNSY